MEKSRNNGGVSFIDEMGDLYGAKKAKVETPKVKNLAVQSFEEMIERVIRKLKEEIKKKITGIGERCVSGKLHLFGYLSDLSFVAGFLAPHPSHDDEFYLPLPEWGTPSRCKSETADGYFVLFILTSSSFQNRREDFFAVLPAKFASPPLLSFT